jgi:hypothetical protein
LNENFPAYHLCTAQTFHSNSPVRLKKSLWESRTTATLVLTLLVLCHLVDSIRLC